MSEQLDSKIDELANKLIQDSRTPISMSNGRQKLRTAQELFLESTRVMKALNTQNQVSADKIDALEKLVMDELAKSEGA